MGKCKTLKAINTEDVQINMCDVPHCLGRRSFWHSQGVTTLNCVDGRALKL